MNPVVAVAVPFISGAAPALPAPSTAGIGAISTRLASPNHKLIELFERHLQEAGANP